MKLHRPWQLVLAEIRWVLPLDPKMLINHVLFFVNDFFNFFVVVNENHIYGNYCLNLINASFSREQLEDLAVNIKLQDYAEAPSTPGLVEEPNLSNVQKALASDDHLEPEDHNSTDLEAIENVGTASSKSDHHGDKHDLQMMTPDGMPVEENEYNIGGNEIQHLKPQGDLLTTENVEHLQNGILSNNEASVDLREVGRDGIVSSPSSSHGVEEDNYHKACSGVENIPEKFSSSSTQLTVAEGVPENDHALLPEISSNEEISKNLSCTYSDALAPISFYPLEPAGPEADTENQVCNEPKDCKTSEPDEEMPSTRVHVLQPCNSDLNHSKKLSHGSDSLVALPDLPNDINGPCSMERSGMEEAIIATGFSVDMQGWYDKFYVYYLMLSNCIKCTLFFNDMSFIFR